MRCDSCVRVCNLFCRRRLCNHSKLSFFRAYERNRFFKFTYAYELAAFCIYSTNIFGLMFCGCISNFLIIFCVVEKIKHSLCFLFCALIMLITSFFLYFHSSVAGIFIRKRSHSNAPNAVRDSVNRERLPCTRRYIWKNRRTNVKFAIAALINVLI